jgi:hypothetical protein
VNKTKTDVCKDCTVVSSKYEKQPALMYGGGGCKDDKGKPRLELVEPDFLTGLAEVLTYGADKYGKGNWKKGFDQGRLYGALLRHANAYWSGETYDPDTGLHHMLHVAVNAMFIHYYTNNTSSGGEQQKQQPEQQREVKV